MQDRVRVGKGAIYIFFGAFSPFLFNAMPLLGVTQAVMLIGLGSLLIWQGMKK